MIASSVTGVSGPGDSKGKYKPENNCSCSCCCGESSKKIENKSSKLGCFKNYKICKNTTVNNFKSIKIKIC